MSFPRLLLLMIAVIFLATLVQFGIVSIAFEKLGLSQGSAYLLLLMTLFGSMINLPLFSVAAEPVAIEPQQQKLYRLLGLPRRWSACSSIRNWLRRSPTLAARSVY